MHDELGFCLRQDERGDWLYCEDGEERYATLPELVLWSALVAAHEAPAETFNEKCDRNARVQSRYDELMREGKHGHYETLFRVVREEVERARAKERSNG